MENFVSVTEVNIWGNNIPNVRMWWLSGSFSDDFLFMLNLLHYKLYYVHIIFNFMKYIQDTQLWSLTWERMIENSPRDSQIYRKALT